MSLIDLMRRRRQTLQIVGVTNALEAALAVKHGADGLWLSSLCLSAIDLLPDEDLISVERISRELASIRRVFDGPVIVDGGLGGSLPQLALLVRACIASGAGGLCIEDARGPKRNSLGGVHAGLRDAGSFCTRLRMMSQIVAPERLAVVARTEGLLAGMSVDETLRRAERYADAGIDALFVHARSRVQLLQFARRWRGDAPLIACPTRFPELSIDEAADYGIAVVLYANQGTRACHRALDETFAALLQGGSARSVESSIAPFDALLALTASQPRGRVDSAFIAEAVGAPAVGRLAATDDDDFIDMVATA